jgi:hypothetical protein
MKHGQNRIRVRQVSSSKRKIGASVKWLRPMAEAETMRMMRTGLAGRGTAKQTGGLSESCTVPTSSLRLLLSHGSTSLSYVQHMYCTFITCRSVYLFSASRFYQSPIQCYPSMFATPPYSPRTPNMQIPTCYGNIGPQVST